MGAFVVSNRKYTHPLYVLCYLSTHNIFVATSELRTMDEHIKFWYEDLEYRTWERFKLELELELELKLKKSDGRMIGMSHRQNYGTLSTKMLQCSHKKTNEPMKFWKTSVCICLVLDETSIA